MSDLLDSLIARAEGWAAQDPDPFTKAELHALISARDEAELADRPSSRVRALGTVPESLYQAAADNGSVIIDGPVLADGRRELLHLLLEQAVSVTSHRFGVLRNIGKVG